MFTSIFSLLEKYLNPTAEFFDHAFTIAAAFVAILSFNSWRKHLQWEYKKNVADEVLNLMYQCRDQIRQLRRISGPPLQQEYDLTKDTISKLNSVKYKFIPSFGKTEDERAHLQVVINEMDEVVNYLILARKWLAELESTSDIYKRSESELAAYASRKEELIATLFRDPDNNDEIEQRVNNALQKIEQYYNSVNY